MTLRAEIIPPILVQAQVEFGAMLYDRFVKRRQQDMVFIVQLRQRDHQQTVVLAGIAVHNRCTVIGTRTVGTENLSGKRLFQIGHQGLFKTQIAH